MCSLRLSCLNENGRGWIKFNKFPSTVLHTHSLSRAEVTEFIKRWATGQTEIILIGITVFVRHCRFSHFQKIEHYPLGYDVL